MASLTTIDVGNSSIGVGRRVAGEWLIQSVREPGDAAALIHGDAVAISVSPVRLELLQRALSERGVAPARVLHGPPPGLACASMELLRTAGTDRLSNALGLLPGPGIAVDAGTAVTIDIVDSCGVYRGGFIAAGPGASSAGLASVTAQLPRLGGRPVPICLGLNTADALGAGLWGAAVGGVDRLVEFAMRSIAPGSKVRLVATGGWGPAWAAESKHAGIRVEPHLVHVGIARWAEWM